MSSVLKHLRPRAMLASVAETRSLSVALGHRIHELAVDRGWSLEDVARTAQTFGLDWTRGTIAALKTGRRSLSVEELHIILVIFQVALPDLESELGDRVALSPGATVSAEDLPRIVRGEPPHSLQASMFDEAIRRFLRRSVPQLERLNRLWDAPSEEQARAASDARGEAEQKAARRLGSEPLIVSVAAYRTWGHSLTEERERRLASSAPKDATPESLQRRRGHVTRRLVDELRPLAEELTAKDRKRGGSTQTSRRRSRR
jgi:transcriptional regulator with XRE-family HTH domain